MNSALIAHYREQERAREERENVAARVLVSQGSAVSRRRESAMLYER
jgi:hypothetical protein